MTETGPPAATADAPPLWMRRAIPLLILLALAMRIVWPSADPASHLSWSNGIYTDAPTMVHAVRNLVLFGEWLSDYNRDVLVYPLMNALTYLMYQMMGVGRFPSQLLSALMGAGTIAALAWGLYRTAGLRAAFLATLLGTLNYWLTMFARVPVAENLTVLMMALACVAASGRSARAQAVAGALGVGATLFGKYHAIGFLPAIVLLPLLRERTARAVVPVLLGGTAVFVLWALLILMPFGSAITSHVERQSVGHGTLPFLASPEVGLSEFFNTLRRSWMFYRIPVIGTFGGFFAIWAAGNQSWLRRRVNDGSAVYAFWLIGMWTWFSLLLYKAPRYYVLLTPPLIAGTAVCLAALLRAGDFKLRAPQRWDEHGPLFLWLYLFCFGAIDTIKLSIKALLDYLYVTPTGLSAEAANALLGFVKAVDTFRANLIWAAVVAIPLYLFVLWNPEMLGRFRVQAIPGRLIRRLALAAVVLSVTLNGAQYAWWATHRTTFIEDAKYSFPWMIGDDAVLLGPFAPLLTQNTKHRVYPYFGPPGDPELLGRYGVTHVLLCGSGDAATFEARYPGLLAVSPIVQVWPVNTLFASTLELRRLPPEFQGKRIHAYQGTTWENASDEAMKANWEGVLAWFEKYRLEGGEVIPELLSMESVCWFNLEDYGKAEELLREAIRRRPLDRLNYQNLGSLHLRRGERAEALEAFLVARRLNPRDEQLEKVILELAR